MSNNTINLEIIRAKTIYNEAKNLYSHSWFIGLFDFYALNLLLSRNVDIEALKHLIKIEHIDINKESIGSLYNILSYSAQRRDKTRVSILLELGADIHFRDALGNDIVGYIGAYLKQKYLKEFVRKGADINYVNYSSVTPYIMASRNNKRTLERIDPHINGRYAIFERD